MMCAVNVAADISGIKVNLSLPFPYRPTVDDVVRAAELAFTNYAQYALGLSPGRAAFATLAAVIFDPFAAAWDVIDEGDFPSTTLAPAMQVYLFRAGITEVQGEIPDPIDAQPFLTPRADSHPHRHVAPSTPMSAPVGPAPGLAPSHRISRGTSTEPTDMPASVAEPTVANARCDHAVGLSWAARSPTITAAPRSRVADRPPPMVPSHWSQSLRSQASPVSFDRLSSPSIPSTPRHLARQTHSRSPHLSPYAVPLEPHAHTQPRARQRAAAVTSPYSRPLSASGRSLTSLPSRSARTTDVPPTNRRPVSPSAQRSLPSPAHSRARSPISENRGRSILQEERDKLAHFDDVSLDHLRADLRREEESFEVSIGSRSVSLPSRR